MERGIVLGNLNVNVWEWDRNGVTSGYEVPDGNESGKYLVDACGERRLGN